MNGGILESAYKVTKVQVRHNLYLVFITLKQFLCFKNLRNLIIFYNINTTINVWLHISILVTNFNTIKNFQNMIFLCLNQSFTIWNKNFIEFQFIPISNIYFKLVSCQNPFSLLRIQLFCKHKSLKSTAF